MSDSHRLPEEGELPDNADKGLDLASFHRPTNDSGLSLSELSDAFAQMLDSGSTPYEAIPAADDAAGDADREAALPLVPGEAESDARHDCCPVTPKSIVEAMLFVGGPDGQSISSNQVAGLMRGVRPAEIDEAVADLNRRYRADGCPYFIAAHGDGYRITLREEFSPLRDKLLGRNRQARLSPASIEVLSLVAYRGPLTSDEISSLRGKSSGPILTQLVRRQLLRIERSGPGPKRALYQTTRRFLDLFGLEGLDELPQRQDVDHR